ncbi:MAG: NAD(P)/FAD-dependent oxidoreductase [Paracoccaceae bacterium]|nr:NAD(P)/FAD-dependent oxidoreductase [Paracoccaceae bacterium]
MIGAGVVGLAIARALARSGREVVILERESLIGSGTSSRNSEVIHAGIYYPAGSLKARFCVQGKRALYDYCASHHIPHRNCGKLIVAAADEEAARLDGIAEKAAANGVGDLRRISGDEAREMEPELACVAALVSPSTGIIDSHAFMLSLLGEAEEAGAMLALETPVERISPEDGGYRVETGGAEPMAFLARELLNSAGHGAPSLALFNAPKQYFARGNYFTLSGKAPFSRLIYPVPVHAGLGVHSSVDLQGKTKFGPDVEWIEREDYSLDPARGASFYEAIRRYWPGLADGALAPDYTGVRPKISGPGEPAADFRVDGPETHGLAGHVALYGIESPGLTSSLAIAEHVTGLLEARAAERRTA